jgi:hypothetical protein
VVHDRAYRLRGKRGPVEADLFDARVEDALRPSVQKARTEKTALITEGALREVTRRTCRPPSMNSGVSSASEPDSAACPVRHP